MLNCRNPSFCDRIMSVKLQRVALFFSLVSSIDQSKMERRHLNITANASAGGGISSLDTARGANSVFLSSRVRSTLISTSACRV